MESLCIDVTPDIDDVSVNVTHISKYFMLFQKYLKEGLRMLKLITIFRPSDVICNQVWKCGGGVASVAKDAKVPHK